MPFEKLDVKPPARRLVVSFCIYRNNTSWMCCIGGSGQLAESLGWKGNEKIEIMIGTGEDAGLLRLRESPGGTHTLRRMRTGGFMLKFGPPAAFQMITPGQDLKFHINAGDVEGLLELELPWRNGIVDIEDHGTNALTDAEIIEDGGAMGPSSTTAPPPQIQPPAPTRIRPPRSKPPEIERDPAPRPPRGIGFHSFATPIVNIGVSVDVANGTITRGRNSPVHLTPHLVRLTALLVRSAPTGIVPMDQLVSRIWSRAPYPSSTLSEMLAAEVPALNQQLKIVGLEIKETKGVGFVMGTC